MTTYACSAVEVPKSNSEMKTIGGDMSGVIKSPLRLFSCAVRAYRV